jgi:hypothetical protein
MDGGIGWLTQMESRTLKVKLMVKLRTLCCKLQK